jgi:uncharacterized membrane protein YgcG
MDKAPATARGTQDITVVWIVFVLMVVALILIYWYVLYKPKMEEIDRVQAAISQKQTTLETYKSQAKELLNYEDQFAAVVHQWNQNQHFFVNGLVWDEGSRTYKPPFPPEKRQEAIFEALQTVWSAAQFAGIYLAEMYVSESLKFYMNDEPYNVPTDLVNSIAWEPIIGDRGENPDPLFTSHIFSVKFYGDMEETRRFIEILQKLEGEVSKIFSIHCFETADEPAYRANVVGLSEVVLTDITLEIDLMLSVHELNPDAQTANAVPDIPGTASCTYGSGGGTAGGGGGGRAVGGGGAGIGL